MAKMPPTKSNLYDALFSALRVQGFLSLLIATGLAIPFQFGYQDDQRSVSSDAVKHLVRDGEIVVSGISGPTKSAKVKVWIKGVDPSAVPPLAGATSVVDGEIIFKPRFSLGSKVYIVVVMQKEKESYRAELDLTTNSKLTVVNKIFPSAVSLPENTLKFYVQFSAPMRKGDIYQYVKIREVDGKEVELPFLEIEQEFWSRDSLRLTLLLDPGRVKRGLKPRDEMGPIFEIGKSYELVISKDWKDSKGNALGKDFVKRFRAGAEDHDQPSPTKWKIREPTLGTKSALEIKFAGPLDRAMLQRAIQILNSSGKQVEGVIAVSQNETAWSFTPNEFWSAGSYKIAVDSSLEDPAGNSIAKQFDVDVFDKTESTTNKIIELDFEVAK